MGPCCHFEENQISIYTLIEVEGRQCIKSYSKFTVMVKYSACVLFLYCDHAFRVCNNLCLSHIHFESVGFPGKSKRSYNIILYSMKVIRIQK